MCPPPKKNGSENALRLVNCVHCRFIFTFLSCFVRFLDTVIWYQVFLTDANNFDTVVWCQIFLSNTNKYLISDQLIGIMVRIFANGPRRQWFRLSHTKDSKNWYLIPSCLTLSIIRYGSRLKWSNPGKGVVPSPTSWYSSYWKGNLRVTLNYDRQLHLYDLK